MSKTVIVNGAFSTLYAIGLPMLPTPMNPTVGAIAILLEAVRAAGRRGAGAPPAEARLPKSWCASYSIRYRRLPWTSRARPRVQHVALGLAPIGVGLLEVVVVRRRLERPVARVREHDPLAPPAVLVLVHHLQALGLAASKLVDEVAEVVAEVQQHPVVLGDVRAARSFRRSPVRLLARHQHRLDAAAHRES